MVRPESDAPTPHRCPTVTLKSGKLAEGKIFTVRAEGVVLRRVENVVVGHRTGTFSSKGAVTLQVGKDAYVVADKVRRQEYEMWHLQSQSYPVAFGLVGERRYWLFAGKWYWDNDGLDPSQVYALLVTRDQRNQARIDRAQGMVAMAQAPVPAVRGAIPDDLKQYIWTRDQGRCRNCGSNVELQFDHIIPVAFGGATSAENLQVLCGPCNRRKGASVR